MKYFAPELLERFQSDDDATADAAQEEWDRRSEAYQKQLDSMRQYLPRDFRRLLEEYRLHDAHVVSGHVEEGFASTVGDKPLYFIRLNPEVTPQTSLLLTYVLAHGESPPDLRGGTYWLYDEVDLFDRQAPPTFAHTILISDGTELTLHFTDFQLVRDPAVARR